jgi:hypothetical protein
MNWGNEWCRPDIPSVENTLALPTAFKPNFERGSHEITTLAVS